MKVLFVMSGKGGVGKSTLSSSLALFFRAKFKVAVLDLDLCGPSIALMLNQTNADIRKDSNGFWIPHSVDDNLACISMSFLIDKNDSAVVWRGARKNALIKELCTNVNWGYRDILIIDTPPGIQDEHISLAELFYNNDDVFSLMITLTHTLSIDDIRRQITFCHKTNIKLIGLIENMTTFTCPNCSECFNVFGDGNIRDFCNQCEIDFIGSLPIIKNLGDVEGNWMEIQSNQAIVEIFNRIIHKII